MHLSELETIFSENDNQTRGPCVFDEPEDLRIPVDPKSMHIENDPHLLDRSLTARWSDKEEKN